MEDKGIICIRAAHYSLWHLKFYVIEDSGHDTTLLHCHNPQDDLITAV